MSTVMSRAALAVGSLAAVAGLLVACTGAEAEEPSPTPTASATPDVADGDGDAPRRFLAYAEEDRELLVLLADFTPSDGLLEKYGVDVRPVGDPITARELAEYQWVVEPAECAPVLNALKNATPEDTTTRGDDSLIMMFGLFLSPDSWNSPEIFVQARIFDDTASTTAFVEGARDADCTQFVERDPSGTFPHPLVDVGLSAWQLPELEAPAMILDALIVEEYDPDTNTTTPLGFQDWNAFVALDRVMVQVKVHETDNQEQIAADVVGEIAAYLEASTA